VICLAKPMREESNAIEAMDGVQHDRRILRLSAEHHGDRAIVVAVEDSGSGIDPKQADRIFEAFVTTKPRGMGLGLAICRMIVDAMKVSLLLPRPVPMALCFE
jgi:signal transduction histidine kinase